MVEKNMLLSFAMVIGVMVASTFVAYVMFSILESSAEASLQNWKFGGAMAGFAFTLITSASLASQFYKQMMFNENKSLRNQIHELNTKLIRGAPCPKDYTTEVDEKYRLIFARPNNWSPRQGILFSFEDEKGENIAPTECSVSCFTKRSLIELKEKSKEINFDEKGFDAEKVYQHYTGWVISRLTWGIHERSKVEGSIDYKKTDTEIHDERVHLDNLPSVKINYRFDIGEMPHHYSERGFVICTYVPNFQRLYIFSFSSDQKNFLEASEIFNNIIDSIRFLP